MKKYKKLSRGNTPPVKEFFYDYHEEFFDGGLTFKGKPKDKAKELNDEDLIFLIDGGRLNKGFEINRGEKYYKITIESFTLKEVREIPNLWEYKYKKRGKK